MSAVSDAVGIGEASGLKAAQAATEGQVAVIKKGLDQQKSEGASLIKNIESAPPSRDLHPTGNSLNVTA